MQDSFTLKAVHLSHFIPMSLAFISTILALAYFPAKTTKIMPGFFYNPTHMYINSGGSMSLLCYLVSIWKNIQAELIWKPDVIKKEPVAQAVLLFFIVFSVAQISDILGVISSKATFITKNEMFLDENLALPQLAECLGISPHQLSQFLNTRLNKNFKMFVKEVL